MFPRDTGFPPSPLDDPGSADRGRAQHGPGEGWGGNDQYRRTTNYDPYRPGNTYPPEAYGPADVYGAADPYGSSTDYDPADPYGPADAYGPEAYGAPDLYRLPDPYEPPDAYGPPGPTPRAPGPPAAPPLPPSGPATAAPPVAASGPETFAPPGASVPPRASGPAPAAPPGPPAPPRAPAPPPGAGAHAVTDPEQAAGTPVPSAGPGTSAGTTESDAPQADEADSQGGLTPEFLLPGRRRAPAPGWRRVVYRATGGLMRVPSSAAELRRRDMINRVRTPVAGGHHRVAILSLKGGVGKTTTTVGLGATLASLRGDRVIAVDANPDRGTLSDKVRLETAATVRDLLNERGHIRRYADVRDLHLAGAEQARGAGLRP